MAKHIEIKIANESAEFTQIAQLNYATFVEEIPQHQTNPDRKLVDKFHAQNTYFIAKLENEIVGMLALRNQRPFSLDSKLSNLDDYMQPGESVCEIRLLAIQPTHRHSRVLRELFQALFKHCMSQGFDRALISGRVENIPMYERLGFKSFAETVGTEGARYQPMYMTRKTVNRQLKALPVGESASEATSKAPYCFLPGPVNIHPSVLEAVGQRPYSHRSVRYQALLTKCKLDLMQLSNCKAVEILSGSGSLANDVIAAHIKLLASRGLIISNGEFGERLVKHADGFDLDYIHHQQEWGAAGDIEAITDHLQTNTDIRWVWCVHCETSTGQLNDVGQLQDLCDANGLFLHIDGTSTLGVVPCDWSRARAASSVSGKGLAALTGLAMVFYDPDKLWESKSLEAQAIPGYLNLQNYSESSGVPFSGSSNLLEALGAALRVSPVTFWKGRAKAEESLLVTLQKLKASLIVNNATRSPAIFTLQLPSSISSKKLGEELLDAGFECSFASTYLMRRNWLQICLMGQVSSLAVTALCTELEAKVT